jgi:hypothetical protein
VVLAGLRDRGVARLDVIVLRTTAQGAAEVVATVRRRWPGVAVLGPEGWARAAGRIDGVGPVAVPASGTVIEVGGLRLTVDDSVTERLDVRIELRAVVPESARAPPPQGR